MQLTAAEIKIVLDALNDREGVLSSDWEAASRTNSFALMMSLCDQLREVRNLSYKLQQDNTPAVDPLDDFNYVGSRHHY